MMCLIIIFQHQTLAGKLSTNTLILGDGETNDPTGIIIRDRSGVAEIDENPFTLLQEDISQDHINDASCINNENCITNQNYKRHLQNLWISGLRENFDDPADILGITEFFADLSAPFLGIAYMKNFVCTFPSEGFWQKTPENNTFFSQAEINRMLTSYKLSWPQDRYQVYAKCIITKDFLGGIKGLVPNNLSKDESNEANILPQAFSSLKLFYSNVENVAEQTDSTNIDAYYKHQPSILFQDSINLQLQINTFNSQNPNTLAVTNPGTLGIQRHVNGHTIIYGNIYSTCITPGTTVRPPFILIRKTNEIDMNGNWCRGTNDNEDKLIIDGDFRFRKVSAQFGNVGSTETPDATGTDVNRPEPATPIQETLDENHFELIFEFRRREWNSNNVSEESLIIRQMVGAINFPAENSPRSRFDYQTDWNTEMSFMNINTVYCPNGNGLTCGATVLERTQRCWVGGRNTDPQTPMDCQHTDNEARSLSNRTTLSFRLPGQVINCNNINCQADPNVQP